MAWTIRPLAATEAGLILPLLQQVHAIHAGALPDHHRADPEPEALLGLLNDMLSGEAMTGLVAVAPGGAALGYALYDIQSREGSALAHAQRLGFLHHISVDRAERRQGIGSALIGEVRARLRAEGVDRLRTTYAAFNAPSAALMRRMGLLPLTVVAEGPA